jgi:ATP-binding cassette, subfamily B, bacterial
MDIFLTYLSEKIRNNIKIFNINFEKPWWSIITQQKFLLYSTIIGEIIYSSFKPLVFILFGFVITQKKLSYFIYLFALWAIIYVIAFLCKIAASFLKTQCIHSIYFNAHKWFLQVDPIAHANRSSGTILSKIERAARSYEDFNEAIFVDIIQVFAGVVVSLISIFWYHAILGCISIVFLITILVINIAFSQQVIIPCEKKFIQSDDKVKSINVETLTQINLIRTCFASEEIRKKTKKRTYKALKKEWDLFFLFNFLYNFLRFFYLINITIIGYVIFNSIIKGTLEQTLGILLFFSYIRGTYDLIKIEHPIRHITRSITRIKDLFSYINNFGKQTFPVLPENDVSAITIPKEPEEISIKMDNLSFAYDELGNIFKKHNFFLNVTKQQENKLYGIIGPSGIGKSTFFSILGGQINPINSIVFINNISIYHVDDITRQNLIALQGQVAASFRGTLKHNLLFGLPKTELKKEHAYKRELFDHDYIIHLLEEVGLWSLFKAKDGLETFIGEGGFTLSGGQRQRLNFANLFLRATYYNPLLILIDEPTSSLDDISEEKITRMITSLATKSVTMVIAHRIKTIKSATGIIDLSLLNINKEINAYTHEKLQEISSFYQKLVE